MESSVSFFCFVGLSILGGHPMSDTMLLSHYCMAFIPDLIRLFVAQLSYWNGGARFSGKQLVSFIGFCFNLLKFSTPS